MSEKANRYEGWLWKWTNYVTGYQQRWFVVWNGTLSYYKSPEEISKGCRGSLNLATAVIVEENSSDFRVETRPTFAYYLRAANETECKKWVRTLNEARTSEGELPRSAWVERRVQKEKLKAIIAPIEARLERLKSCRDTTQMHGSALSTSLTDLEKTLNAASSLPHTAGNGDVVAVKDVVELVTRFHTTCEAMVTSCSEFVGVAERHTVDWQNLLERDPNLADQAENLPNIGISDDEEEFQDATDSSLRFAKGYLDRDQTVTDVSDYAKHPRNINSILEEGQHRATIPFKPDYKLNLWAILKNCIGRDISKLPVPVNFSEPLSILQRLSEEVEYSELLDKAARCTDSCEQMTYVAAFSVSSYSTTADRTGKPFNPMLGETYELDCADELGFRFIAEQVSHHPPKAAVHVESRGREWSYWHEVTPSSKFRGNYLTLTPIGTCHVLFHASGNHYTWTKVTITVNNIILGKLWFDESGESVFINHTTGDRCRMKFFSYNYFDSSSYRKLSGTVTDKSGEERYFLHGYWNKSLQCRNVGSRTNDMRENVIWKVNPLPPQANKMYYFTRFAIMLNEWVEGTAPTDSRRRPDQRKMEETYWDEANQIKLELEQRQRMRRKEKEREDASRKRQELQPDPYQPLWFKRERCSVTGESAFVYTNKYWESKQQRNWSRCANIFDLSGKQCADSAENNWPDLVKSARIVDPELPKTNPESN